MFRLLALIILAIVVISVTGSLWWIIPVLVIAAIVEGTSRSSPININIKIDN